FIFLGFFFFSSRRRHTRSYGDWSSDVCSSDLIVCKPLHTICSVFGVAGGGLFSCMTRSGCCGEILRPCWPGSSLSVQTVRPTFPDPENVVEGKRVRNSWRQCTKKKKK